MFLYNMKYEFSITHLKKIITVIKDIELLHKATMLFF